MFSKSAHPHQRQIPLRIGLITPFIVLTVLTVSAVGYLSYKNGLKAVNDVTYQLQNEISQRISHHFDDFVTAPRQINRLNRAALTQKVLAADDAATMERHFVEQVRTFRTVSSIYFGNPRGGLVNSGREGAQGDQYTILTDGFRKGPFRKYATTPEGSRGKLLMTLPEFDARSRVWYRRAVAQRGPTWCPVYILYTGQDLAVAASSPVYDADRRLLGVVSVDLFLSQLSQFLNRLTIGKTGYAFIFERDGCMVASSAVEKLIVRADETSPPVRLTTSRSAIPAIRSSAAALKREFGDLKTITAAQQVEFDLAGKRHFLRVSQTSPASELDWLIAVVLPEDDFMAVIRANNRTTLLLILGTIIGFVSIGLLLMGELSHPIRQLGQSAQDLSQGKWGQEIPINSRYTEISTLAKVFNHMSDTLARNMNRLQTEISEHKRAEVKLTQSEARFRAIFEQAAVGVSLVAAQSGTIISANQRYLDIFGLTPEAAQSITFEELTHPGDLDADRHHMAQLKSGKIREFTLEKRFLRRDQTAIWCRLTISTMWQPQASPECYIAIVEDITRRKEMEGQLQSSLQEKDILLSEIQHRVKNNIQVITSLLALQSDRIRDPHDARLFRDIQDRIAAMSLVHELLYQSDNFSEIDFSHYLHELISHLRVAHGHLSGQITVIIDSPPLVLDVAVAVPLGLVVNEIVTNSLEHAFPDNREGTIFAKLSLEEASQVALTLCDDGIGMPEDCNLADPPTVGMQLIRKLVEYQLGGRIEIMNSGGTLIRLRFSIATKKAYNVK